MVFRLPRTVERLIVARPATSFIVLTFAFSYVVGVVTLWAAAVWLRPFSEIGAHYAGRVAVAFGPAAAAFIVASVTGRPEAAMRLLARLTLRRRDLAWIALIPACTLAVTTLAFVVADTPASTLAARFVDEWHVLVAHYVLGLLCVGIGEEIGWRGWLLPTLLERRARATATLLVAAVWCVWHGPALFAGGRVAAALALHSFSLSFLFTALWSRTGRNVLLVAIAHASVNAAMIFFENAVGYPAAVDAWLMASVTYAVFAGVLVATTWSWWTAAEGTRTGGPPCGDPRRACDAV